MNVEDQTRKTFASNIGRRFNCLMSSFRKCLSNIRSLVEVRSLAEGLLTILKIPVLMGLFALDISVVMPLCICLIPFHGGWAVVALILSQSPIIYLVLKEAYRQMHMLPMSEAWETSTERWQQLLDEYAKENKKT